MLEMHKMKISTHFGVLVTWYTATITFELLRFANGKEWQ